MVENKSAVFVKRHSDALSNYLLVLWKSDCSYWLLQCTYRHIQRHYRTECVFTNCSEEENRLRTDNINADKPRLEITILTL